MGIESKIQFKNKQELQFFDDEDETGESHTIFMGPVEKWEKFLYICNLLKFLFFYYISVLYYSFIYLLVF